MRGKVGGACVAPYACAKFHKRRLLCVDSGDPVSDSAAKEKALAKDENTAGWRDLNDGLWQSHGGFELALTPLVFGALGYWLDGLTGTRPVLTVLFVLLAFGGVVAKTYYMYRFNFDRATAARSAKTSAGRAHEAQR